MLIIQFVEEMWNQLKLVYGVTSTIRLRDMMLEFETDLMNHKHIIMEHFRVVSVIIRELQTTGNRT